MSILKIKKVAEDFVIDYYKNSAVAHSSIYVLTNGIESMKIDEADKSIAQPGEYIFRVKYLAEGGAGNKTASAFAELV